MMENEVWVVVVSLCREFLWLYISVVVVMRFYCYCCHFFCRLLFIFDICTSSCKIDWALFCNVVLSLCSLLSREVLQLPS